MSAGVTWELIGVELCKFVTDKLHASAAETVWFAELASVKRIY